MGPKSAEDLAAVAAFNIVLSRSELAESSYAGRSCLAAERPCKFAGDFRASSTPTSISILTSHTIITPSHNESSYNNGASLIQLKLRL